MSQIKYIQNTGLLALVEFSYRGPGKLQVFDVSEKNKRKSILSFEEGKNGEWAFK